MEDGMVMGWCLWIPFCAQRGCWIRSCRGNFAKKSNGSVIWIPIDLWDAMILFLNPSVWKSESTLFSKKTESSSWSNRCMAMHDHAWPANWTCIHPALCTEAAGSDGARGKTQIRTAVKIATGPVGHCGNKPDWDHSGIEWDLMGSHWSYQVIPTKHNKT